MKKRGRFKSAISVALVAFILSLHSSNSYGASFVSGSTGVDGAFAPTANIELQLPPDGIFNFTTVDLPAGVTVTFKRNTANTPVYILATGDVNIVGTISVSGENGKDGSTGTGNIGEGTIPVYGGKGGPGGFDGGRGGLYATVGFPEVLPSAGLGPGGGKISSSVYSGGGGGYVNNGDAAMYDVWQGGGRQTDLTRYGEASNSYGNVFLLPLVAGSGGGGGVFYNGNGGSGGGGGGAILIASSGTINIIGGITAIGGNGGRGSIGCGGGGSGGAIRLIAKVIRGNGTMSANGGSGVNTGLSTGGYYSPFYSFNSGTGSPGRIRLEAYTFERTAATSPASSTGSPSSVFIANIPSLTITNIGGTAVPASTTGAYATPDITLPSTTTNPVIVNISAANVPVGTTVTVMVIPVSGASSTVTSSALSGTNASSTTTASITLPSGAATIIQASATFTVQTASNQMPMYADGEKVVKIKVAAVMGGKSTVTYITESGKEVLADM